MAAFSTKVLHSNQKISPKYYTNTFCQFKRPKKNHYIPNININGGSDGTRTRDLLRDRQAL